RRRARGRTVAAGASVRSAAPSSHDVGAKDVERLAVFVRLVLRDLLEALANERFDLVGAFDLRAMVLQRFDLLIDRLGDIGEDGPEAERADEYRVRKERLEAFFLPQLGEHQAARRVRVGRARSEERRVGER